MKIKIYKIVIIRNCFFICVCVTSFYSKEKMQIKAFVRWVLNGIRL